MNQRVASRMLEKLGAVVVVAANGREAVDAFMSDEFDLVFMDCQMPAMDGYDATRAIRAIRAMGRRGRSVPIVALTGHAAAGDRDACLAAGMDDYVAKPTTFDRVEARDATLAGRATEGDSGRSRPVSHYAPGVSPSNRS